MDFWPSEPPTEGEIVEVVHRGHPAVLRGVSPDFWMLGYGAEIVEIRSSSDGGYALVIASSEMRLAHADLWQQVPEAF